MVSFRAQADGLEAEVLETERPVNGVDSLRPVDRLDVYFDCLSSIGQLLSVHNSPRSV